MASVDRADGVEKGAMEENEIKESDKELALLSSDADNQEKEGPDGKEKSDGDVVFIQDTGFTVKVIAPNLEPFDIQVKLHYSINFLNGLLGDIIYEIKLR